MTEMKKNQKDKLNIAQRHPPSLHKELRYWSNPSNSSQYKRMDFQSSPECKDAQILMPYTFSNAAANIIRPVVNL